MTFLLQEDNLAAKMLSYNRANRAVAILCNHQVLVNFYQFRKLKLMYNAACSAKDPRQGDGELGPEA